jgi:hypothetical protein
VHTMRVRVLVPFALSAVLAGCAHPIATTVHRGAHVTVGFDVREANGRAVPVTVTVQTRSGSLIASTSTTPWSGPALDVDDGTLVVVDATRAPGDRGAGSLRCHVETFDSSFVLEMLVTSREACQVRGVVASTDVNLDAYGPRS